MLLAYIILMIRFPPSKIKTDFVFTGTAQLLFGQLTKITSEQIMISHNPMSKLIRWHDVIFRFTVTPNSISNKNIILSSFPQFCGPNTNAEILALNGCKHCPDLMAGYKGRFQLQLTWSN